jgi:hypothetical protein
VQRLVGGGSSDAYDLILDRTPGRVVVRVFRDGDDSAPLEWSHLTFAQRVTMPAPEPIAADLESTWFGRPAIVHVTVDGTSSLGRLRGPTIATTCDRGRDGAPPEGREAQERNRDDREDPQVGTIGEGASQHDHHP